MATPATYTASGSKATSGATLNDAVFGVEVKNHELLKQAYVSYLANGRVNLAVTKTRGLVSGGGKKPWRQKGTGRARFGSSRNPIWRTGGIVFGPTGHENYRKQINLKAKRLALRQALSLAAASNAIIVIEDFTGGEGKVKPTAELLSKLGATGSVLLAVAKKDNIVERATRNLTNVKAVSAMYLNVFDLLNADTLVISKPALDQIHAWLNVTSDETAKEAN